MRLFSWEGKGQRGRGGGRKIGGRRKEVLYMNRIRGALVGVGYTEKKGVQGWIWHRWVLYDRCGGLWDVWSGEKHIGRAKRSLLFSLERATHWYILWRTSRNWARANFE